MYRVVKISVLVISMVFVYGLFARPSRVTQVPNGNVSQCQTCHTVSNPSPGNGPRNDFGKLIEAQFLTEPGSNGEVIWNALLANLDADNDGVSNGEELQDRFGAWEAGQNQPGNSALVTAPGNTPSNNLSKLTIQFSNMTPHVGELLELRVIDKSTGGEVGRKEVSAIPSADFAENLDVLLPGRSYWIDLYTDFNNNSLYDAPPTDHAWRLEVNNVTGDETVNFSHNANFVDIQWVYEVTVKFSNMAPHIGQLLELRVTDQNTGQEVGRKRLETIKNADFDISVPGIHLNNSYNIDFYADLNGNFQYDTPPTDHTWRIPFISTDGDESLDFSHNTNFTDIEWNYQFILNLALMTPHLGQMFEIRLYNSTNSEEIGYVELESILVPDFIVTISGLTAGNSYNADFYADLNKNGSYDAPPTDHAWRISFNGVNGNIVENFTHNVNFIDIEWPISTDIQPLTGIPSSFALHQNYPNPFNPETSISFDVASTSHVKIEVFNALGQRMQVLADNVYAPGSYKVTWNGRDNEGHQLSSGIYIYQMTSDNYQQVKRMLLMK